MTDSRPPDPPDNGGDDLDAEIAALFYQLPIRATLPIFITCICEDILANPKFADAKHLASHSSLKKICTTDGMNYTYELWRLSRSVSPEALEAAGMKPGSAFEDPTCTSMGKKARKTSGYPEELIASLTEESCIICCRRVVDGLVHFDYAERVMENESRRPVYATSRLNPVMMRFTRAIEPLFREAAGRLAAYRAEQERKKKSGEGK